MAHASETVAPRIKGHGQTLRMAALTCSLIGLQFTWSVEMTYFTPYLLQLGLDKSQTALVWLAPPLSGFIVQPIIGVVSDSATWRWGRRRPYMLVASAVAAICLLTLGWVREVTHLLTSNESHVQTITLTLAVFCIYALDFAINIVQATSRSLIVDVLPTTQQQLGSAWAGRMLGVGHLIGYFIGTLDLVKLLGTFMGGTQFKQVCIIASCLLLLSVAVTCWCVKELVHERTENSDNSWLAVFRAIFKVALSLPTRIQAICWITFWCWIGWSPFHIYATTWVGEIYFQQNDTTRDELRTSDDIVGAISRRGAVALFLFSIMSFTGSIVWPWIVKTPEVDPTLAAQKHPWRCLVGPSRIRFHRPDLVTAWAISQILFSISTAFAPFTSSYIFAITVVALCGTPWAMYGWAPLALLGEEINRLDGSQTIQAYASLGQEEVDEMYQPIVDQPQSVCTPGLEKPEPSGPSAGIYLGIWNMFATVPQFIATLIATAAFAFFEPGKSFADGEIRTEYPHAISGTAFCLAVGAAGSLVAATLTFRLHKL